MAKKAASAKAKAPAKEQVAPKEHAAPKAKVKAEPSDGKADASAPVPQKGQIWAFLGVMKYRSGDQHKDQQGKSDAQKTLEACLLLLSLCTYKYMFYLLLFVFQC